MNDPEEVTMGTDPNPDTQPPGEPEPSTAPETPDTTPPPETPSTSDADTPPPEAPVSDTSGADDELIEEEVVEEEVEVAYDPDADDREGLGEPLGRATTVADDTAPGGHVQTDADGNPRQAGDSNPELGVAPDKLPEGTTPTPPLDEFEPDTPDIDRPDVGTPVTDTQPEGSVTEPPAEEE